MPSLQTPSVETRRNAANESFVITGLVALVGCPADADLLSLKAAAYLEQADVVLHDRLVPRAALDRIRGRAIPVGKTGGGHATPQSAIHALMLEEAYAGHFVVRLHGGDPGIYGHLGDELEFLRANGIRCDVVPAVSAAQIAASKARAPLTRRGQNHRVTLISGHCMNNRPPESVPGPETGNLAVYMGVAGIRALRGLLCDAGWGDDTSVVIGEQLGTNHERIRRVSLGQVAEMSVQTPAVYLVGAETYPGYDDTLFVGSDTLPHLRHGPFVRWAGDPPDASTVRVFFASAADVARYFEALPGERTARRTWLAGDTAAAQSLVKLHLAV